MMKRLLIFLTLLALAMPVQAADYTIRGGIKATGVANNDSFLMQRNATGQYYYISGSDLIRSTLQKLTTSGENYLSAGGLVLTANPINLSGSNATGTLAAARFPALTGDLTTSAGSLATTLATVNTNVGSWGSSTAIPNFIVNGKGLITVAGTNSVIAPAGTLTGTTLASNVVNSSLTSVGTLGTLTVTAPITGSITGNAATVTTNANLTGPITSVGNATTLNASAQAIPNGWTATTQSPGDNTTKLATTAYVVANAASATLTNTHVRVGNVSNVATDVAISGDATLANTGAVTLATVNGNTGAWGSSTAIPVITLDGKGRATAASTAEVIAPAGTLTGNALPSGVKYSSVTQVGTVTAGTWNATTVDVAHGGTAATALGNGISNAGNILDTTNGLPDTRLTGGIIYASDRGLHVNYAGASSGVFFISSASAANFTGGWGTIFSTTGAGGATIHADSGTVCGQTTFSQPAGSTIYITSDNNNFRCDLPNALPLVIGTLPGNMTYRKIITTTDANGQTITAGDGTIACQNMQYSGVITGWSLWSSVSGSAVVDWWNGGSNIPTVANTITASAKPTLSSNTKATSTTLTGWTTTVTKGDWICAHIDSATTVTRLTSQLFITVTN